MKQLHKQSKKSMKPFLVSQTKFVGTPATSAHIVNSNLTPYSNFFYAAERTVSWDWYPLLSINLSTSLFIYLAIQNHRKTFHCEKSGFRCSNIKSLAIRTTTPDSMYKRKNKIYIRIQNENRTSGMNQAAPIRSINWLIEKKISEHCCCFFLGLSRPFNGEAKRKLMPRSP